MHGIARVARENDLFMAFFRRNKPYFALRARGVFHHNDGVGDMHFQRKHAVRLGHRPARVIDDMRARYHLLLAVNNAPHYGHRFHYAHIMRTDAAGNVVIRQKLRLDFQSRCVQTDNPHLNGARFPCFQRNEILRV